MKVLKLAIFVFIPLFSVSVSANGDLLLVGGSLDEQNAEIFDKFIELAGGVGVAKIGCICTASADPEDSGQYYVDLFTQYGALEATYIPVTETSNNADDPEIVELLRNQTGFFFGGGDQARITAGWKRSDGSETLGLTAIKEVANDGGVIGGTSAGISCQGSGPMIEGGLSWQALKDGASPGGYNPDLPDNLVYIENGTLGNLDYFILDSHFSERGREGRLTQLLLDTGNNLGMGIDENTAIHIGPTGDCEILGSAGGVMIIDTTNAVRTPGPYTTVTDVKITFYTEDDKFNLNTGETTYASWKNNMDVNWYYTTAVSSDNIFSSPDNKPDREYGEFRYTAKNLYDSNQTYVDSTTYEKNPIEFLVSMRKENSVAYGGDSPTDGAFKISYKEMMMDISYIE